MELLDAMTPDAEPVASWSAVGAPALVLGRSHADPALDEDAARAAGVAVVRRSSGGGPVLWDEGLLALDLVLPRGHRLAPDDVVAAYRPLGEAIAAALRTCGVGDVEVVSVERARAWQADPGGAADACYGGLSPFEVLVGGRKVVGLSQTRRRTGALLQAGILERLDAEGLRRLLGRDENWTAALRGTAVGLDEVALVSRDDLVAAVDRELDHI